jgi:hypothetical protein
MAVSHAQHAPTRARNVFTVPRQFRQYPPALIAHWLTNYSKNKSDLILEVTVRSERLLRDMSAQLVALPDATAHLPLTRLGQGVGDAGR